MKKTMFLLLGSIFIYQVYAQEKTDAMLFGDVKSAKTKEHIPYANIMVKGTHIGTVADKTGHFKLSNLPLGKLTIVARVMGYKEQEKEVIMEKGKSSEYLLNWRKMFLTLIKLS